MARERQRYDGAEERCTAILLCAVPRVDKLPLSFSAETTQFIDSRYMANCENCFSFKAVDSDGKDSCMTAYRNQNKIDNSR